jgi:hypothetical protein
MWVWASCPVRLTRDPHGLRREQPGRLRHSEPGDRDHARSRVEPLNAAIPANRLAATGLAELLSRRRTQPGLTGKPTPATVTAAVTLRP